MRLEYEIKNYDLGSKNDLQLGKPAKSETKSPEKKIIEKEKKPILANAPVEVPNKGDSSSSLSSISSKEEVKLSKYTPP